MKINTDSGEWQTYAHYASENGTSVLPEQDCQKVAWFEPDSQNPAKTIQSLRPFTVQEGGVATVGHQNGTYTDFYGVLTITMVLQPAREDNLYQHKIHSDLNALKRQAGIDPPPPMMCIFYIGARGPGIPVQHAQGFEGARCNIQYDQVGDYYRLTASQHAQKSDRGGWPGW